jgi:anti-sigma-K factor RskA
MTTTNDTARQREPSEIELLLPWYAAGTLSPGEARQVAAALAGDPELASRYEWVRAELAQETHVNEAAAEPSGRDATTLFAKIDALPARRRTTSLDFASAIAGFLAALSPRTLAWSAVAAALLIALQAGLLAGIAITGKVPGGYETASVPATQSGEGAFVLIRFQPQATAAEISNFLEANKLSIVGGPSGGRIYRVRVASTKLAKADLARVVATLQNDKVVGFIAIAD